MKNPSAIKRHKESEKRRMRNRVAKSAVRTMAKKYTLAVREGKKDDAVLLLKSLVSKLDTVARKGIIKMFCFRDLLNICNPYLKARVIRYLQKTELNPLVAIIEKCRNII